MRVYVGEHDLHAARVFISESPDRPTIYEVREVLREITQLSDELGGLGRPDERWDIRVGVWMELKAGTPVHMVARAHAVTIEFVESVQQHGLFPSYYRIIRRDERVMVDDGSGVFVTWTSPSSPDVPASRSSSQSSSSVSRANASQEAFA